MALRRRLANPAALRTRLALITFAVPLATTAGLVLLIPVARTAYPAIPTPLPHRAKPDPRCRRLVCVAGGCRTAGRALSARGWLGRFRDRCAGDPGRMVGNCEIASSRSSYRGVECIRSFRPGRCSDAWDHVEERISVAANSLRGWHRGDDNAAMVVGPFGPGTVLPHSPRNRIRSTPREFQQNNREADFDERLQSSALTPAAWPTGAQSTSSTGRREQRRLIRSPQRRISLPAERVLFFRQGRTLRPQSQ